MYSCLPQRRVEDQHKESLDQHEVRQEYNKPRLSDEYKVHHFYEIGFRAFLRQIHKPYEQGLETSHHECM